MTRRPYIPITDPERAQMVRLRKEGKTYAAIAELIGRPPHTVRDWFKRRLDEPMPATPHRLIAHGQSAKVAPEPNALPWATKARLMSGRA